MLYRPWMRTSPNEDLRAFAKQVGVSKREVAAYMKMSVLGLTHMLWRKMTDTEKAQLRRAIKAVGCNSRVEYAMREIDVDSSYRKKGKSFKKGMIATQKHLAISLPMQKGGCGRVYTGQDKNYYEGKREWD